MGSLKRQIAVIGSGVAGLSAAYVLSKAADVTLYEADSRFGGHAHTHEIATSQQSLAVDSGFIVHNNRNYPLLRRLFTELGVATQDSEMSMSVRCDGCGLEYCGARGASGLFARGASAVDPRYIAMLAQVPVFHRQARRTLAQASENDALTLGEFLARGRYSKYFVHHFVIPLVSAVWSCGPHRVSDYPAKYLFAFLNNHGMLSINNTPQWRTVTGGSKNYVERITKQLTAVRTMTPVRRIYRADTYVDVHDDSDTAQRFDGVVVATHADQALQLLNAPSAIERDVLGAFTYSHNNTVLHNDASVLPRRARAQGSWNYRLPSCEPGERPVQVSYHLNRLQRLNSETNFIVTLGDNSIPNDQIVARMKYQHPVYTAEAVAAQQRLSQLNTSVTAFAGAYHGWGFHEDGCRAGIAAANSLGVRW